jgi:hypothetical protein
MLDAMHLTEITRACAALTKQAGTNNSHPGVIRLLARTVLALVFDRRPSSMPLLYSY